MVYEWFGGNQGPRINLFNVESKDAPKTLIQGQRAIRKAVISPNGKWIAYSSAETGKFQIYVERFPELGQKVQISIEGGINPYWSRDGKQIFYRNDDRFMAVPLINDLTIDAGPPRLLFQIKDILGFDVFHPTGEFFVLKRDPNSGIQTQLHLVTNWFPELQRLAPSTNR